MNMISVVGCGGPLCLWRSVAGLPPLLVVFAVPA